MRNYGGEFMCEMSAWVLANASPELIVHWKQPSLGTIVMGTRLGECRRGHLYNWRELWKSTKKWNISFLIFFKQAPPKPPTNTFWIIIFFKKYWKNDNFTRFTHNFFQCDFLRLKLINKCWVDGMRLSLSSEVLN